LGNTEVKRKPISKQTRLIVWKKYNHHCAFCGCQIDFEEMQVDHEISLYWHGGEDNLSNYMPSCRMCNYYKSTFTIEEFRQRLTETMMPNLRKDFSYRMAVKYGLIEEHMTKIKFYFETCKKEEEENLKIEENIQRDDLYKRLYEYQIKLQEAQQGKQIKESNGQNLETIPKTIKEDARERVDYMATLERSRRGR
jgi:hypothetical protein